jgi:HEAT repeat protein
MKLPILTTAVLALLAWPAPAAASPQDEKTLRDELVKARLEILDLKLRLARAAAKPDDENAALVEALASPYAEVAAAALREISMLPDDRRRAALPAVLQRKKTAPESFRIAALELIGRINAPEALEAVVGAAEAPSPAVRRAAASALRVFPAPRALEALLKLTADADVDVRISALDALGVAKREGAVPSLLARLEAEKNPKALEKAVDALGAIGSAAAVEPLLALVERTEIPEVRWSCINSLGQIGDPRAAARLRAFLATSRTPVTRQVTLETLGRLRDLEALPLIQEILIRDPEEKLRERAAAAVGLMADPAAVERLLVPAYVAEASETVRRAIWAAMVQSAADRFDAVERFALAFLALERRVEADQLCARLHAMKVEEALRPRAAALEEKVALAAYLAGDPKSALPHFRQLAALQPGRTDVFRRIAACYRDLKDLESCVKTLREVEARMPKGEAGWWEVRLEILSALEQGRDAEVLADEAHALLALPQVPEDRRKAAEAALRTSALRLAQPLAEKDEPARRAALEALKRQGKRVLPALAAELEAAKPPLQAALIEAGNAIAATQADLATTDPARLRELAAAWREWAAKP